MVIRRSGREEGIGKMSAGEGKESSRRRFLKWAGSFAVIGGLGVALGSVIKNSPGQEKTVTETSTTTQTQPAVTTTATTTEMSTELSTETQISTETSTATNTQVIEQTMTTTTTETLGQQPTTTANSVVSPTSGPAAGSFSIFWITDTQFLSEQNPSLYRMLSNWIVRNWGAYNGKLVIHTGDVVQNGDQQQEWVNANEAMKILTENGIPYTWCAGNHDDWVTDDEASGWIGNVWGAPSFDPVQMSGLVNSYGYTQWVGDFHSGMNTALTFTANGINFLVINIEWNADPTVLQWAEGILDNPFSANYKVIVAPHAYIDAFGEDDDLRWGPTLANFVNGLVPMLDSHPNVFLTLNGHFATDAGYYSPVPVNGMRNELMFDRQDCCDNPTDPTGRGSDNDTDSTPDHDKVGGATVTILNFDTANNIIHASTFDLFTALWRNDFSNEYSVVLFPTTASGTGSGAIAGSPLPTPRDKTRR